MSITPVSDIVLDVARAADPARSAAATARLARLAEAEPTSSTDFAKLVERAPVEPLQSHVRSAPITGIGARPTPRADARTEAVEGLERLVLQKLVESMLPNQTSALFGHGTAGDVWRSMLAEQLATKIGSVVDLGLGRATPWVTRSEPNGSLADPRDTMRGSAGHPTDSTA